MTWLLVGLLGFLGVLCRFSLGQLGWLAVGEISLSVLLVNMIGSAIGGVLLGAPELSGKIPPEWYAAITVGFLGGLTTLSAVTMDTMRLFQNGLLSVAFLNLFLNNFLGLAACFVGYKVGSKFI